MARRNKGIIEDIFEMCSKAPWWFGVAAAAVFGIIGLIVSVRMSGNPMGLSLIHI